MLNYLLVAGGGAFGSMARYFVGVQATRLFGRGWPYGTFAANVIGGFCMGLLVGLLAHRGGDHQERWRILCAVGVLGGFTTFSSFSLEVALMIERREFAPAAAYAAGSVGLAVIALFGGLMLARRMFA